MQRFWTAWFFAGNVWGFFLQLGSCITDTRDVSTCLLYAFGTWLRQHPPRH
jgi:hypothetical protein